jgi:hypothetical protein
MGNSQVVVGKFGNEIEAEIARGHLQSAGIRAIVIKDDVGGAFPSLQGPEGVRLTVEESDAEKAKKILKEKHL